MKKIVFMLLALIFALPALAGTAVSDLAIVNVTPVKAELFFRTSDSCLAKVIYHGPDNVNYLAQEETASLMHHVVIKNLNEATDYVYELKLETEKGQTEKIKKDEFSFTTATFGVAMPCNVYGYIKGDKKVYVTLKVHSAAYGAESLALLTQPAKGVWTINLGDLKNAEGKAMAPKAGDVIFVTAYDTDGNIKTSEAVFNGETIQKLEDLVF